MERYIQLPLGIPDTIYNNVTHFDLLTIERITSLKKIDLPDGSVVRTGERIGKIHIQGMNERNDWRKLSYRQRGGEFLKECLRHLSYLNDFGEDAIASDINVFYLASDIIRPEFFNKIGLSATRMDDTLEKASLQGAIKSHRSRLNPEDVEESKVGEIYEAWITRDMLRASREKRTAMLRYLEERFPSTNATAGTGCTPEAESQSQSLDFVQQSSSLA